MPRRRLRSESPLDSEFEALVSALTDHVTNVPQASGRLRLSPNHVVELQQWEMASEFPAATRYAAIVKGLDELFFAKRADGRPYIVLPELVLDALTTLRDKASALAARRE